MRIAISHLSLNFLGGEERLCLSSIDALKKKGHHVTLFTVEKTHWKIVQKVFGDTTMPDEEIFITSLPIHNKFSKPFIPIFSYLNYIKTLINLLSSKKYDVIINTYGDIFTSIADVSYVHFPLKATLDYYQIPAFTSPITWKAYSQTYKILSSFIDNIRPSILLTNSKFTQQVIKKYLNRKSLILHPPVEVKKYLSKTTKRKNHVITISKFTPKRNLHKIPLIAQLTKNTKFIIVGVADQYSSETIKNLLKDIQRCGVENRVVLLFNVSHSALIDLLVHAKAYLHTVPFEHFGISIIEAMAAGCVPIVHKSGGPWLDILNQQQGENGFAYGTVEEAAQAIDLIISDENLCRTISSNAQKRSLNYDVSIFQKKLNALIHKIKK